MTGRAAARPTAEEILWQAEEACRRSKFLNDFEDVAQNRYGVGELLEFALGRPSHDDETIPAHTLRRFDALLARRLAGEPIAYLTGSVEFCGLPLTVGPGAFIPRPASEFTVDQIVRRLRKRSRPIYVDAGTGVGPLPLAVAKALPHAETYGLDISTRAIRLARRNARKLGIRNSRFLTGDLFAPLPRRLEGAVDLISANPPYVARGEMWLVRYEARAFEPKDTLTDFSKDGMGLISRMVAGSMRWLRPGGWLLIEISPHRSRPVWNLMRRSGFTGVRSKPDPGDIVRVVLGRAVRGQHEGERVAR